MAPQAFETMESAPENGAGVQNARHLQEGTRGNREAAPNLDARTLAERGGSRLARIGINRTILFPC
jgi:hypothetical protein